MLRSILALAMVLLVADVAAGQCPSTWRPQYNVDCHSAAKPYACGGGDVGQPKCVAALPSCDPGYSVNCQTCLCAVDSTPTPVPSGGGCSRQTLSRSSATAYTFSPALTTLDWCRIDLSDVQLVSGTPGQNQAQMSGSTLNLGWPVGAATVVECCGS